MVTIKETRRRLSQIVLLDQLAAQCTERRRVGCPAIHQHELHVLTLDMRKRVDPANQLIGRSIRDARRDCVQTISGASAGPALDRPWRISSATSWATRCLSWLDSGSRTVGK